MLIAWTTVSDQATANELASSAVAAHLAACVQVEGPITSHYTWEGAQEKSSEYRLAFKLLEAQLPALETWLHARHPYQTPEWIVVRAEHVSEKYLSWARANPNNLTL